MIKNFSLFKNEKKQDNHPDYKLSAKVGDKYVEIGAGFIKEGKAGKFISISLSKPYKDRKGYIIVEESTPDPSLGEIDVSKIDF